MRSDLRLALRSLLTNPGFSTLVVLTLALGIDATTATYSVVSACWCVLFPTATPIDSFD